MDPGMRKRHHFTVWVCSCMALSLPPAAVSAATSLDVVISEIMYHPPGDKDNASIEYIELTNRGGAPVDLTGWTLGDGIRYSFPTGIVIPAGARRVVAGNVAAVQSEYSISGVLGPWEGRLDNGGERIEIRDSAGGLVGEVSYNDTAPWPTGGDGDGRSIELTNLAGNHNAGHLWLPSSRIYGSPGTANSPANPPVTVVINEFMANPAGGDDWVELYNYGNSPVDLNNFYLTDNPRSPTKARITSSWSAGTTIIQPKSYWISTQSDWGFGLSSGGEQLYLIAANGVTWVDGYDFGNQPIEGATEGRFPDAGERWYKFINPTQAAANQKPAPLGVIINEIMYHPAGAADPGAEYVELRNTTGLPVDLSGWELDNGITYTIPGGTIIPANGYLVIAADPAAVFSTYGVNAIGPYAGKLSNFSDEIELLNHLENREDFVEYRQEGLWPVTPDGNGPSLERATLAMDGRLPGAWRTSSGTGTPGAVNGQSVANPAASVDRVIHAPLVPTSSQQVTVTALVGAGSLSSVTLRYKRDQDGSFSSTGMFDDGLHGDGLAGDGVFGGTIPAQSNGTTMEFYIQASATGGNATFPLDAPGKTCLYIVQNSVPSSNLTVMRFVQTDEQWNSLTADPYNDARRDCTFIFSDKAYYNCGIRFRSGARSGPKYSYKVYLPPGYQFRNADRFNLNFEKADKTMLKNKLFNRFIEYMGLPEAQTEFIHTHYRNSYVGVHLYAEAQNEDFLDNHFPGDSDGNLYKAINPWTTTISGQNIAWGGSHSWYEKESNEELNNWSDMDQLYNTLKPSAPQSTYEQNAYARVDVVNWARSYAILGVGCLIDVPWHIHNQNHRLYRRTSDNRFIHILYDFDDAYWPTMWNNAGFLATVYVDVGRLYSTPSVARELMHGFWMALNTGDGAFREDRIMPEVRYYHGLIYNDVDADPITGTGSKWTDFTNGIGQWQTWLSGRNGLLRGQLPVAALAITTNGGQPIATASPNVMLSGTAPISAARLEIFGSETGIQWGSVSGGNYAGSTQWSKTITLVNQNNVVLVRTLDDDGNEIEQVTINVTYTNGIADEVDFTTGPLPDFTPYTVAFQDLSTAANITAWSWDFGDGGVSSQQHPSHTYAQRGTYNVALTIQADGGPYQLTQPITFGVGIAGDYDLDGDVDLDDYAHMQLCQYGPGLPVIDPTCVDADLDGDNDVDLSDAILLNGCLSGAGVAGATTCP